MWRRLSLFAMVRFSIFGALVLGIASMLPLRAAHAGQSSSSKATKKSTKAPPDYCTAVGACAMCDPLTEADASYCAATNRRQKFACSSTTAADEAAEASDSSEVDTFNGGPSHSSNRHRWKDTSDPTNSNGLRNGAGSSWSSGSLLGGLLGGGSSGDSPSGLGELQSLNDGSRGGSSGSVGRRNTQRSAGPAIEFYACASTPEDDVRAVAWFEVWMAVLFGVALWGVRTQKNQHLTLYERRKRATSGSSGCNTGSGSSSGMKSTSKVRSRSRSPSSTHSNGTKSDNSSSTADSSSSSNTNGTPSKGEFSSGGHSNSSDYAESCAGHSCGNGPLSPSMATLLDFTTGGVGSKEARSPTPSAMKKQVQDMPLGGSPSLMGHGKERLSQRGRSTERPPDFDPGV